VLDEFLLTLSNEAQLKIALRLTRLALPIWQKYHAANPGKIAEVNNLVSDANRVDGAYKEISVDLPEKGLAEIESAYEDARARSKRPATVMKEHALLHPILFTFLGPLTNSFWDETLPNSVRLVFTAVWNILTWLIYRERNDAGETHIYIAVNQAADALHSENIMSFEEINVILMEYSLQKRYPDESGAGGMKYDAADGAAKDPNEIYQKIIGPTAVKDPPSMAQAAAIVRQMREEGKSYWDDWEEYYTGTNVDYSYDLEEKKFKRTEADVIVGSFFNTYWLSEAEMIESMQKYSLYELRKAGFNI
jgi:hypothetical protein